MKITRRILYFLLIAFFVTGCSTLKKLNGTNDPAETYKNFSEERLFNLAEKKLASKRYAAAIRYYEALAILYPFGEHSQQALLDSIYAYYENGDYTSAAASANTYIHLYPRSEHADYAYYMKGMSQMNENQTFLQTKLPIDMSSRDMTSTSDAFFTFRDLIQLYPESHYRGAAHQRLIYLRNLFAKHELDVAQYYYDQKAYVAASNRASYIIQHYEGAPQQQEALVILMKSNSKLGANEASNDAREVLQVNYPQSNALK
ncbi:MAG: outer membrane protein assembly factor BamD [Gammaproteobacteria bacterium]